MSWELGLARWAACVGGDLQRAARSVGGGHALWQSSAGRLERVLHIDAASAADLVALRRAFDPAAERAALATRGILHVGITDSRYPPRLAEIVDPPFGLFVTDGTAAICPPRDEPVVAVVGSRRATAFGLDFARGLASALAGRGALVVSGLALGIDAQAHIGALEAGAVTLAVVGAGVDVDSPRRNAAVRERIIVGGAVVSEYWPGTEPAPWRFPARNRIIAGLADAVVVVEAGERSGALITADFALEQGRPVLAVPGLPGAPASAGCNALIRAGAAMCEGVDDVIAELTDQAWASAGAARAVAPEGLDGLVYGQLSCEPLRVDELADRLGRDAAALAAALARLELDGHVVRGHEGRYWAAPLCGAA